MSGETALGHHGLMSHDEPFDKPQDVASGHGSRPLDLQNPVRTAPADPADKAVDPDEPMDSA